MSCKIANYTTADAIRASLGLTDNEVPDAMITDQQMDVDLLLDLGEWLPTHADIWSASKVSTATAAEQRYGNLLSMYSQWYCAVRLCEMWLAMPQRISDGKADMRRFAELDLEALLRLARARLGKFKAYLEEEVLDLDPRGSTLAAVASPTYDPVTGTET